MEPGSLKESRRRADTRAAARDAVNRPRSQNDVHAARRWGSTALALFLLVLAGCAGEDNARGAALEELERLVFVPPGPCVIELTERMRVDCSTVEPLLVDRFETTREDWLVFLASGDADFPAHVAESWSDRKLLDRPATFMTLEEARAFARWRGMRVPTAAEWVRIAAGTRVQRFPWGGDAESIANTLELGLGRTTDVGTFEEGASPGGVHDLVGNVWEWVEGRLPATPVGDERTWAMGGSHAYRRRPIYGPRAGSSSATSQLAGEASTAEAYFNVLLLDPRHRADDVGLRCVVEAREYLWNRASSLGSSAEARARLVAVGRRFGPSAVTLLAELAARPNAPPALGWLLEGARG